MVDGTASAVFMGLSFAATGHWFITGGFYVPDPALKGHVAVIVDEVRKGVGQLAGPTLVDPTDGALAVPLLCAVVRRKRASLLLPRTPRATTAPPRGGASQAARAAAGSTPRAEPSSSASSSASPATPRI